MTGKHAKYSRYTGFNTGVAIDNVPVSPGHAGKVFWVGNNATLLTDEKSASDGNDGSFLKPFSTVDYAVGQCAANRGDVIYIRPNHTTTVSAADTVDFDVAGITVVGLGNGTNRPRFDYTAGAGEVAVGADNVTLQNINFHANVDSVLIAVDIEDGVDFCTIRGCLFDVETTGTDEFDNAIRLTNNNTGCVIEDNEFDMGLGQAVRAVFLDADTDRTVIRGNLIQGDYSTANIGGDTTASTDILIEDNILVNGSAGNLGTVEVIELLTGTTGVIRNNGCVCNVATPDLSIVADTCIIAPDNWYSETVAGAAELLYTPRVPDSTYNFIGVDDSNNAAATTNVTANRDGSILERLEDIRDQHSESGDKFVVQKTLTSSAITTGGVDITGAAASGNVVIEDIIIETDATGLAAGTNFTIEKDGGSGVLTFFAETVANLGGNATEVLSTGSVTASNGTTLDSGQKLVAKCTASNCTGTGTITLTLMCARADADATVAAA